MPKPNPLAHHLQSALASTHLLKASRESVRVEGTTLEETLSRLEGEIRSALSYVQRERR